MKIKTIKITIAVLLLLSLIFAAALQAQGVPKLSLGLDESNNPKDIAVTLQIILLLTVLSLVPAILVMMTSFTRIAIVLSLLRHGLATQTSPPTQVIIGLALFLTVFIMAPVGEEINETALQPYLDEQISQTEAYQNAVKPLREFMLRQTREKDLALFVEMAKIEQPETPDDLPTHVLLSLIHI